MQRHWIIVTLLCFGMTACAAQGVPIHGSVLLKKETFTGTMQKSESGDGTVSMTSSLGAKCTGKYSYLKMGGKSYLGNLDLTCDDGRTGGVALAGDSDKPSGLGTLGKDVFILGE